MADFAERTREVLSFFKQEKQDMADIIGKSRPTVSHYASKDPAKARTPDYADLVSLGRTYGLCLNWWTGLSDGPMWGPSIMKHRVGWRAAALDMRGQLNVHQRLVALINIIRETAEPARNDWWIAGALGLGGDNIAQNLEHFSRFMLGAGATDYQLRNAVTRVADITGLSEMWIQLGDITWLEQPKLSDLGAWSQVVDEYQRRGHRPSTHKLLSDSIDRMVQEYQRLDK